MRVEILCTGNELLDGSVVDSNSAWFESKLFALGLEVAEKRVVPDDLAVITAAMREISARADFLLVSGGLGPTVDDLSAEALANAAGVPLVEDARALQAVKDLLARRGREFTAAQARQARVPAGAEVILNDFGSAPHIQLKLGRCQVALLPGVPREFFGLSEAHVLPRIAARVAERSGREHYAFTQLRCYGVWEADMAWAVRELPQRFPGLRIGTRTAAPENHLKLRAAGASPAEAQATLDAAVAEARAKLGDAVFAVGEQSLPEVTVRALAARGATVALAESCTGGLAAALLTDVSGSSAVLKGSLVTYTEEAKARVLGLDPALIAREGVVSHAVAVELAARARALLGTTYGVGVTGWAGPTGGTERDPVGTFYVGFADAAGARAQRHAYPGLDRERVRRFAAYAMLNLLRLAA